MKLLHVPKRSVRADAGRDAVYRDESLGAVTFSPASSRVSISSAVGQLNVSLRWMGDEKIEIQFNRLTGLVVIGTSWENERIELPAAVPATLPEQRFVGTALLHPSSSFCLAMLQGETDLTAIGALVNMAGLLVCGIGEVKEAAARRIWREPASSVDVIFTTLANRGVTPSGVLFDEGQNAALTLRETCPQDRLSYFRDKALEMFGPTVAGVKVKARPSDVTFKNQYTKPIIGGVGTYVVYTAPSKDAARAFLETYKVKKDYFYVEVETPEGPVGKDKMGIY